MRKRFSSLNFGPWPCRWGPDPTEQQLKTPVRYACDAISPDLWAREMRKSIKTERRYSLFPSKCAFKLFEFTPSQNSSSQLVTWSNLQPPFITFSGWTSCKPMEADGQSGLVDSNYVFFLENMQSWGKASEICTQQGPQGAAGVALDFIIISNDCANRTVQGRTSFLEP